QIMVCVSLERQSCAVKGDEHMVATYRNDFIGQDGSGVEHTATNTHQRTRVRIGYHHVDRAQQFTVQTQKEFTHVRVCSCQVFYASVFVSRGRLLHRLKRRTAGFAFITESGWESLCGATPNVVNKLFRVHEM